LSDFWIVIISLAAVLGLIAANGLFVATEFAYVAVRRTRIEQRAEQGHARARLLLGGLNDLDTYIAATQLGVTMSSLALGFIAQPAAARLVEPAVELVVSGWWAEASAHSIAIALTFSLITGMLIVFGELAPKMLALQRSEETALWVAAPIAVFNRVFRPFIWTMNRAGRLVVRPLGLRAAGGSEARLDSDELGLVIAASARAGLLSTSELHIARRALEYSEIQADQVMVPRMEVVALAADADLDEVLETVRLHDHRRYPVFDGDLDNTIGILDTKDLIRLLRDGGQEWRSLVRPVVAIPESVSLEVAVAEMRARRVQVVILIDEHGGTSGILTADEVLDRLLGRWHGGGRQATRERIHRLKTGNFLLDGQSLVTDVEEVTGVSLAGEDYDTIGGFLMSRLGRIPRVGDRVTEGAYDFRVMAMEQHRVDRVLAMRQAGAGASPKN
jgi:magnesium and cobalt exporter, CNNM family